MSDPIINQDVIGIPAVGDSFASHTNVYGSKWEMGIAVGLINRKFDFGTIIRYSVAADPFGSNHINTNSPQFGVTATTKDINSLPGSHIQHGDKAVLGPSTYANYEGYSESIRVAAAAHHNPSNADIWTNGVIYSLDRLNKYKFSLSDPVTVYGTGQGFGWFAANAQLASLGITKGYSGLGAMSCYSPNMSDGEEDHVDDWEKGLGDNFIGLKIMLPTHSGYNAAANAGPTSGPGGGKGPAIFNSVLGLAPWRDAGTKSNPGDWDWAGDKDLAGSTIDIEGVFRYVRRHEDEADYARFAYNSNVDANYDWGARNSYAPILTGFVHGGGQYKDTAQCLFVMVNSLSNTVGTNQMSNGIFSQLLVRSLSDSRDVSYAKLVPGTYYRLGLTWKGDIQPDNATNVGGSEVFAKFQWGPFANVGDVNHYQRSILSTQQLLNSAVRSRTSYRSDTVSGFVQTVDVDDLDSWDNLRIDLILRAKSPTAYSDARQKRGAEIKLFVDNVWLEHEGDIPGASNKGYVQIDHYPEAGTLTVNRFVPIKPVRVQTPTTRRTVDPTGAGQRQLFQIDADFERVHEDVYEQFKALEKWQDLGYKLTLHPFLPQLPHCLVGDMEVSGISRHFWDISRFSFHVRFTETE